ncbi:MAG: nitrate/nitrite transporter [Dehalococcoidia bacterium]
MIKQIKQAIEINGFSWHYAWIIVLISSIIQTLASSIRMTFGVLITPLSENFNWSQGDITLAYAISNIVTALSAPLAGSLGDRFGEKKIMIIGSFIFIFGLIFTGYSKDLTTLYISYGFIIGIGHSLLLVPLMPVIMKWFKKHLALGISVWMTSWGIGPALSSPIIAALLNKFGWQNTFWIIGIIFTVSIIYLLRYFYDTPESKGILAYGISNNSKTSENDEPAWKDIGKIQKLIRNTQEYWNMCSIHFLGCVGHSIILIYIVPIALFQNITLIKASIILSLMSGTSIISRFLTPLICEKFGIRTFMSVSFLLQSIPVFLLFGTNNLWIFYFFAIIFGIGYGGEAGGFPILNRRYFGNSPMGGPTGIQFLGGGLGMALGGWIGGMLFDFYGNYDLSLLLSICASTAGMFSILLLQNPSKTLIPQQRKLPQK